MSHVILWYDLHLYLLLGATWQKNCEGREWTFANVCLFSQPCDKSVRQLLFLSVVDNYMISYESAYSLLFVSGSWIIINWRKWAETLQTHFSVSCADCGRCCWLILIMFIYLFQKLAAKLLKFLQNRATLSIFFTSYWYFVVFYLKNPLFTSL